MAQLDIDALLDRWVYNIERTLRTRLAALAEDSACSDPEVAAAASEEIDKLLDWIMPPNTPVERLAALVRLREETAAKLIIAGDTPEKAAATVTMMHPAKLLIGRPKTQGTVAVRALTLHLTTDATWREITLNIKGSCEHICPVCQDAERQYFRPHIGVKARKLPQRCPKCRHTIRPVGQRQQVCSNCADALRDAVGKLEAYLREQEIYPFLPRRIELARMSVEQIQATFDKEV